MSDLWLNTCVTAWSWLAQVAPAAAPGTATPATTAPTAATAPAATQAPVTAMPAAGGLPPGLTSHVVNETHTSMAMNAFHGLALVVYFLLCVGLMLCVMFQNTKSEGLAGVMGGSSSAALFKGKKSGEETLGMWTSRLAVAYIAASFFIWLIFGRGGA